MIIIAFAIINSIIWTILTIRWKALRSNNVSPVSAFGLLAAGLPLWLLTLGYLYYQNSFVYSQDYFINLSVWTILCIATNLGALFILKFKALSELGIYRLAISTFTAMLIEAFILHNDFNTPTFLGVGLLLIAGSLLPKNTAKKINGIKLGTTLLLLLFLSFAGTAQFIAYKNALIIQSLPLFHAMLAQTILYIIFLPICFKSLKKDYLGNKLKISDFIVFGTLIYLYTIIEAYLFKELPITLLIALSVINIILFQIYDIKNKELKHGWRLYMATLFAIVAIIMIKFK